MRICDTCGLPLDGHGRRRRHAGDCEKEFEHKRSCKRQGKPYIPKPSPFKPGKPKAPHEPSPLKLSVCPECQKEFTQNNTGGRRWVICPTCRGAREKLRQEKYDAAMQMRAAVIREKRAETHGRDACESLDSVNRSSREGFRRYFTARPFHFESIYHLAPEMIGQMARELFSEAKI